MGFPDDVDVRSFNLGMIYAFIEVVASGCKRLGLSPPMTAQELEEVRENALEIAAEYGVATMIDPEFLVSRLFNPAFTDGKEVMLFALDPADLEEYMTLKGLRARSVTAGTLSEHEEQIARRFGRLLSYSEEAIEGLLKKPRF